MPHLSIQLFGHVRLYVDSAAVRFSAPNRSIALLAYLLLHGGEHPRDSVAFELWPEAPEPLARTNLRRHSLLLQRALPPSEIPYLISDRRIIGWNPRLIYEVDVHQFEAKSVEPITIPQAIGLYTGDLLVNLGDLWLVPLRERLRELHISNLVSHARAQRSADLLRESLATLDRCLELDPWREEAVRERMLTFLALGERAKALETYTALVDRLTAEFSAEPASDTRELHERIATASDTLPKRALPARPASSFLGRERELLELPRMLEQRRLVTLVGAPGVGKTRLALETIAAIADNYTDGVTLVDLATIADNRFALRAIAVSIGAREGADSEPDAAIAAAIRNRQMLLVLDNCEHVIDDVARLCNTLLPRCRQLSILATSREPVVAEGESLLFVEPLSVAAPPDAPGRRPPAAQLFLDRAANHGREVGEKQEALVLSICERLDGLPLAIELAAARLRTLDLPAIVRGLDDRMAFLHGGPRTFGLRHRMLEANISWSYELLSHDERQFFDAACSFRGTFSLDAAAAVAGVREQSVTSSAANVISSLVEKSMVVASRVDEKTRYSLLETMRAYALHRLAKAGNSLPVFERHAAFYTSMAIEIAAANASEDDESWLARIAMDRDNLEAALDWALTSADQVERAGIIAASLIDYWLCTGQESYAVRTLEAVTQVLPPSSKPGRDALCALAFAYRRSYYFSRAIMAASRAVEHHRAANDKRGLSRALLGLGSCVLLERDKTRDPAAISMLREALDLAGAVKDRLCRAEVLYALSVAAAYNGEKVEMIQLSDDALSLFEMFGKSIRARHVRLHRAVSLFQFGDFVRARHEAQRASAAGAWPLNTLERALLAELKGWLANEAREPAHGYFSEALELSVELGQEPLINARLANFVDASGPATLSAQLFGYLVQREREGTLSLHPFLRQRLFDKEPPLRRLLGESFGRLAEQGASAEWVEMTALASRIVKASVPS